MKPEPAPVPVYYTFFCPPYEIPTGNVATYHTFDVHSAVKQFMANHKRRPDKVYQDITAEMVYIPLEQE